MAKKTSLILVAAMLFAATQPAAAQQVAVVDGGIQPVAHAAPLGLPAAPAADRVTFAQQPTQVGDRVAQTLGVDLQIQTTITQAGQQAHQGETTLRRKQQRFVEVLEVAEGAVRRAHVTFPVSRVTSPEHEDPAQEVVQPVEGKSYLVTRDGERLRVTATAGSIPAQAEFEIVVTSLQNLGLPNPLIKFLLNRTVQVGERLTLPQAVAEQLMGFGDQFGKVKQFELELKSIDQIDGQRCAVFGSTIEAIGEPANPVRIKAFGEVVIQAETSRTVRAELSRPLSLSPAEHTPAGSFAYKALGNVRLAVQAQYGRARQ